ncbi:hypothetical protein [Cellulomonas cellasea]|uniref:Uncharacterized protein n=2 Tax=Cellulomonas cellasea TaxID=43670 RepID=A0A0A0B9U3_9CELL|nr:hypothetical protein [Cellulomonas cellasea]KGM02031.1 hypothetical protein Q760_15960 [Cellulomonas cellasea DSM 20118]GEA86633.1 hypothetical protein CCE01nite_05820 [Cellulomonas cellasea]
MHSDGSPLPDLSKTAVLHSVGVIRTDQLPGLAARWLAADLVDTEAVRMLAGHGRHDPWALEQLLRDALEEAHAEPPREALAVQNVVAGFVAAQWQHDRDTRGAVLTLARLGASEPDLDLGPFAGLADEWAAGWGRPLPELEAAAETELERYLLGD